MHLGVQIPRIRLHVAPIVEVPGCVDGHRCMLLHNILYLSLESGILLAQVLIPHVLYELGKLIPVHEVAIARQLTALDLNVVLTGDLFLFVDLKRFGPLLKLLVPVFFLLGKQVLLRVVEDALRSLWLLQQVIRLNQLLNRVARRILELLFPVVEGLGIGVTVLGNLGERLRREKLDVLAFIKLHELSQVQDLLKHLISLAR